MVKIDVKRDRVAEAIFRRHERDAEDWRRPHLGASVIGDTCLRRLWYGFRWAVAPKFDGRMLRLFERGHREEDWIVEELRLAGMDVRAVDENGKQVRFSSLGGHFAGSCDGQVLGVPGAPKTVHLLEVKTSNDKRFAELLRDGVRKAQPKHFAQMQVYMHAFGLKRALYVCVNKNDDRVHTDRLVYDKAIAEVEFRKANVVIFAAEPPERISEDPAWFECKFCGFADACHGDGSSAGLERNCRTCASSTPTPDGTWICEHFNHELTADEQRIGCNEHLFIPGLLHRWEPVGVNERERTIRYAHQGGGAVRLVDHGRKLTKESDS